HSRILGEEEGDQSSRLLEQNLLNSYVPRATTELKNAYVLQKIEEIKIALKKATPDDENGLITQLQQLQQIKRLLAKELGERIILKY
ncbi:MAG: DNA primase, partial [Proteiniphilum sp.]